jgi:hypothetical protein
MTRWNLQDVIVVLLVIYSTVGLEIEKLLRDQSGGAAGSGVIFPIRQKLWRGPEGALCKRRP